MPVLVGVLLAFVAQLLLSLGIGFATYAFVLPSFENFIQSYFSSLPSEVIGTLGILRLDIFMTLIISAASFSVAGKLNFVKK